MAKVKAPAGLPAPDPVARMLRTRRQGASATTRTLTVAGVGDEDRSSDASQQVEQQEVASPPTLTAVPALAAAEPSATRAPEVAPLPAREHVPSPETAPSRATVDVASGTATPEAPQRVLAAEFKLDVELKQRSVALSGATMRRIREWERSRRSQGLTNLGPAALIAAACVDVPMDVAGALDLVGTTPQEAFDRDRFQATVRIPTTVIYRLEELKANLVMEGLSGRVHPWQVVAAAVSRQLDAEGGFGFGTIAR